MKKVLTITAGIIAGLCTSLIAQTTTNLRDDVVMHVATSPIEGLLNNTEDLLIEVAKGTPGQMFAVPGVLSSQLPTITGLPPAMVDFTQSVHVALSIVAGKSQPLLAVRVPIKDFDNQIKLIGSLGFTKTDNGLYEKVNGQKIYLGFLGTQYAVFADTSVATQYGLELFKTWKDISAPTEGVTTTIEVNRLMKKYGAKLSTELKKFNPGAIPGSKTENQLLNLLYPIIQGVGMSGLETLKEINTIKISEYPSKNGLRILSRIEPKKGSALARTGAALASATGVPASFNYLPAKSAIAGFTNWNQSAITALYPLVKPIIEGIDTATGSYIDFKDFYANFTKTLGSSESYAVYFDEKTSTQVTVAYLENTQAAAYTKQMGTAVPKIDRWLQSLFKDTTLPFTISLPWKEKAGSLKNVTYSSLDLLIQPADTKNNTVSQEELEAISTHQRYVVFKDALSIVSVQGNKDINGPTLAAAQHYKNKTNSLGKKEGLIASLSSKKNIWTGAVLYPLDTLKMTFLQQANQMAKTTPYGPLIVSIANDLKPSTVPFMVSGTASAQAIDVELTMPAVAINELIVAALQGFTKLQMQQRQMVPPVPQQHHVKPLPTPPAIK